MKYNCISSFFYSLQTEPALKKSRATLLTRNVNTVKPRDDNFYMVLYLAGIIWGMADCQGDKKIECLVFEK